MFFQAGEKMKEIDVDLNCVACDYKAESITNLKIHCKRIHGITADQLCLIQKYGGVNPLCQCGCTQKAKYSGPDHDFRRFLHGHGSRVYNPWNSSSPSRPAMDKKSSATKIRKFASGEIKNWNLGLTKETDERLKKYGEKASQTIKNDPERVKARSQRMSQNRRNGVIPTLYGPDSSQWNGGTSSLNRVCHAYKKFYDVWKFPKLKAANFKCSCCGSSTVLQIHHDQEKMCDIVRKVAEQVGYDFNKLPEEQYELKLVVADKVADYHIENNVSGVVLCDECHKKQHKSFNFKY